MRVRPEQLAGSIKNSLSAVYLLSGDEPLQLGEAADLIRAAAKKAGYLERELFQVEGNFDWDSFRQAADSLSLFSERRLIDLRIPTGKPGREGSKALQEYCSNLPSDTILLISTAKLAASAQKAVWFKALEKVAVVVQVWPLEGGALIKWLQQRMASRGLQCDQSGVRLLAERLEGNLLAAAQEIDKLYVLHGSGKIDSEMILDAVANSARFDVFSLTDAALSGKVQRVNTIMNGLREEAIAPPVILWALAREARILFQLAWLKEHKLPLESVYRNERIWDKRKVLLGQALQRLTAKELEEVIKQGAKADLLIKGQAQGDSWDKLQKMALGLAGVRLF
jgi:DNA polymerase-3 subunit delta